MKFLLLIFAILLIVSQAQQNQAKESSKPRPSAIDSIRIATKNPLHSDMRKFGLQELAKKALASHGVQFSANPEHKIHSVRTDRRGSLEVTFEADIRDVYGKAHRASFVVARQARKNWMGLKSYTLSKK